MPDSASPRPGRLVFLDGPATLAKTHLARHLAILMGRQTGRKPALMMGALMRNKAAMAVSADPGQASLASGFWQQIGKSVSDRLAEGRDVVIELDASGLAARPLVETLLRQAGSHLAVHVSSHHSQRPDAEGAKGWQIHRVGACDCASASALAQSLAHRFAPPSLETLLAAPRPPAP